mmetsp:Transcript_141706/g.369432  ORF Transcript_141706/g.369432 Transcript_141706/m.369432 type:complete len:120 (+) Transcript_141706:865-1224(+)
MGISSFPSPSSSPWPRCCSQPQRLLQWEALLVAAGGVCLWRKPHQRWDRTLEVVTEATTPRLSAQWRLGRSLSSWTKIVNWGKRRPGRLHYRIRAAAAGYGQVLGLEGVDNIMWEKLHE